MGLINCIHEHFCHLSSGSRSWMGSEVCERLDDTLLGLMESLKELSSLRNRYRDVVREVGIIWSFNSSFSFCLQAV